MNQSITAQRPTKWTGFSYQTDGWFPTKRAGFSYQTDGSVDVDGCDYRMIRVVVSRVVV